MKFGLAVLILGYVVSLIFEIATVKKDSPRLWAIAQKFGYRKVDEMERRINETSMMVSYQLLKLGLLIDAGYHALAKNEMSTSGNLFVMAVAAEYYVSCILNRRNTAGDEEYKPYPLWKSALKVLFGVAAIFIVLLAAVLGHAISSIR